MEYHLKRESSCLLQDNRDSISVFPLLKGCYKTNLSYLQVIFRPLRAEITLPWVAVGWGLSISPAWWAHGKNLSQLFAGMADSNVAISEAVNGRPIGDTMQPAGQRGSEIALAWYQLCYELLLVSSTFPSWTKGFIKSFIMQNKSEQHLNTSIISLWLFAVSFPAPQTCITSLWPLQQLRSNVSPCKEAILQKVVTVCVLLESGQPCGLLSFPLLSTLFLDYPCTCLSVPHSFCCLFPCVWFPSLDLPGFWDEVP